MLSGWSAQGLGAGDDCDLGMGHREMSFARLVVGWGARLESRM